MHWRRWLVRARDALVHLGLSDQSLSPRSFALEPRTSNANSLIFLMIGRDAANGRMSLTPLLRRFGNTTSTRIPPPATCARQTEAPRQRRTPKRKRRASRSPRRRFHFCDL